MTTEEGAGIQARGFAEIMNNFNKLTEIESRIEAAIQNSKIPWVETRKFLKGLDLNQVLNTPLAQFIQDLFKDIGLGSLRLTQKNNYEYLFRIDDCPICSLFKDLPNKKVCRPTADAISRFFIESMGLESEVEEVKCCNSNDGYCEFKLDLQPFTLLEKTLDKTDLDILALISQEGITDIKIMADRLHVDEDEIQTRLVLLQYYETLDSNFKLTVVGKTFYDFRSGTAYVEEPYFEPPWKNMAELTSTIAATQSFAEALVVVTEEEELPWEIDESELIDIQERTKDKMGFAELLSSEMKKSEKDDEDENT